MHIVLGLLGTIVTILVLLNRLAEAGIDLGGLNPFLWQRRRRWRSKFEANPVFTVESPMEVTALLMTATVKLDGDMSAEEKKVLLSAFQNEFHLSKRDAAGLLVSSAHLLGKGDVVREKVERVMQPSLERFTEDQAESALALLDRVGAIDTGASELKREFIDRIRQVFESRFKPKGKWQ